MKKVVVFKKEEFRKWLKSNHKKEEKMAVVLYKRHTGNPAPTHRELIDEAICFGWIDTTVKRIDDDTFLRHFSKRNKNSTWSDNTIGYAKALIKEGRMSEEGMKYYKLGLKKPTHDHGIPKNPNMPKELKEALLKNKKANENFKKFPPSTKKMIYRWFLSGKLQETRKKRVRRIVEMARDNSRNIF